MIDSSIKKMTCFQLTSVFPCMDLVITWKGKIMNKKMLILTLLSLLNISYLFSQSNILEIPYTFRPSDARGTALGLTGTAYSEGLFSIYTNPAGLSFMKKAMISYSHYPKIKYGIDDKKGRYNQENLGLALRINKKPFCCR